VVTARRATAGDAPAVTSVVLAAFEVYVERLGGVQPWPMTLDYAKAASRVEDVTSRVASILGL